MKKIKLILTKIVLSFWVINIFLKGFGILKMEMVLNLKMICYYYLKSKVLIKIF